MELCTTSFTEAPLPAVPEGQKLTSRTLPDYIASLPGVADAKSQGKPALVYFFTRATKPARGRSGAAVPTRQARACEMLEKSAFRGRDARIGVAAKLFVCSKTDVTSVTPQRNPVFNTENAPIVLLTASDGDVVALLAGKVRPSALLSAMLNALRKSGIDGSKVIARGNSLLNQISTMESQMAGLSRSLGAATNRVRKAESAGKSPQVIAKFKAQEAHLKARMEELQKNLAAVYDALKTVFSTSGARNSKEVDR